MKKISGILPANSRVTTVDLKNSGVSRPGGPSFGRQVGLSSVDRRKQDQMTTQKAQTEFSNQMQLRNEEKDPKVEIVQKMADNFFKTRLENSQKEAVILHPEDSDMNIDLAPVQQEMRELAFGAEADDDAPVTGRYLDVKV